MATALTSDIEQIVGDYLRRHPAVSAVVRRVVSRTPDTTATPWVRYQQIANPSAGNSKTDHLVAALLQFDCYAGADDSRETASLIARTVRAALIDMRGQHGDAYITAIPPRTISATRMPDPDVAKPTRERYVVTATVYAHAVT